jgi:hypothetical protein
MGEYSIINLKRNRVGGCRAWMTIRSSGFVCSLLNNAFQLLRLRSVNWRGDMWLMSWGGCGRKRSWPNFRYYPSLYMEWLRKSTDQVFVPRFELGTSEISRSVNHSATTFGGPVWNAVNTAAKTAGCISDGKYCDQLSVSSIKYPGAYSSLRSRTLSVCLSVSLPALV